MEIFYFLLFLIVSFLYSSVGHGGASGYIAILILIGFSQNIIKPNALFFNLIVSLISFISFYRAKFFKFSLFWPFAITSIPMAYLGGISKLPTSIYKILLAIFLIIMIFQLIYRFKPNNTLTKTSLIASLFIGGLVGFFSGLLGIGGGIILSPIILFFRWATIKETAAISALFIFVNSLMGLMGFFFINIFQLNFFLYYPLVAIIIGGILGSGLGSRKFSLFFLKVILIIILSIALIKLFS